MSQPTKGPKILPLRAFWTIAICIGVLTLVLMIFAAIDQLPAIFDPPRSSALSFNEIDEVIIHDSWQGESQLSPLIADYVLSREAGQFTGTAEFSVGYDETNPHKARAQLAVPEAEMQAFLDLLSKIQLVEGPYSPYIDHTDDYPEIEIILRMDGSETIRFYTESQGENHAPWKITNGEQSYVENDGVPAQALAKLKRHLRQDVLEDLIQAMGQ